MLVLLGYSLATAKVEEAVQTPVDLTCELDWDQIGDAGLEDPATQSAFLQPSFQNPIVHWIIHGGPVSVWGSPPLSTDEGRAHFLAVAAERFSVKQTIGSNAEVVYQPGSVCGQSYSSILATWAHIARKTPNAPATASQAPSYPVVYTLS